MNTNILFNDFDYIINSKLNFELLRNKTILVTGATGLIGSYLIRFLLYCNKKISLNIKVLAVVRNEKKANVIFKNYDKKYLKLIISDLEKNTLSINDPIDYIVHTAAVTNSKALISDPMYALNLAINGTESVLNLAKEKKIDSMIYLSSMEVYGQPLVSGEISEDNLGYINLNNIRSGYPESKRVCEYMCNTYAEQYDLGIRIVRTAQTFGAGILPNESRVFAQFAKSIIKGENLVLHTAGNSEGNYVYIADTVKGILWLLFKGLSGQTYNLVNEQCHISIKEMANLVVDNFGNGNQKVVVDIPKENMGYAPEVHMKLSGKKLMDTGWTPEYDLKDSYYRLIAWLKSENQY
jgi:nucleoside-diphosphate-sugar epimerase